jgi:CoA:oxalate CoA-transferase
MTQRGGATQGPFAGLTVIDLTRVLAGPFCTMMLGDLGARVIKVEPPGGDDARGYGPFIDGESAYFASLNRGKESIALDLKAGPDRAIFETLLSRADIVVENYRAGAMEKLGLGWEALHACHPRLIYAAVSGFGHTGPYATRPAYDMVVQAMGGLMSLTGHEGGPPTRVGTSIGDLAAALFAVNGIGAALYHRERTGEAIKVDVGMLDSQVALLENAIARLAATGVTPGPMGARHPSIAPIEAYAAEDGYMVIAAGNDALFRALCLALGRPGLPDDPRFASNAARCDNADALKAEIETALRERPVSRWIDTLQQAGVPCGPINTVADVAADPHIKTRNMIVAGKTSSGATLMMAGNPVKLSGFPDPATRDRAPRLDEHRDAILKELETLKA